MTTGTATGRAGRSRDRRTGHNGSPYLLRAEWTKLRTVRSWVIGLLAATLATLLVGLLIAAGDRMGCGDGPRGDACPSLPRGPGGEAVRDTFSFVHQSLTGDGSITARVTSMTGLITYPPPDHDQIVRGVVPWAKAGLIVKDGTRQGSAYAAVMVTGEHGVRMQHDYTEDVAGSPDGVAPGSPRWLRLTRSGDTLTGWESADGARWTKVGTARLAGLPETVQVGLFAASPDDLTVNRNGAGGSSIEGRLSEVTAAFDDVAVKGAGPAGAWRHDDVGKVDPAHHPGRLQQSGDRVVLTGSGDIAPLGSGDGQAIERTLSGTLVGIVVMIVVAALFVTAEHRRGLLRVTLLASPRRGRVLAAKAIVIGAAAFAAGLVATAAAVPLGQGILRSNGFDVLPVSTLTELRVVVGTAGLLAVAAVFALALGVVLRRGTAAVVTAIVAIVLPYVLATASFLPESVADWLLRVTPAAGFAIQQSLPEYAQASGYFAPETGYFPLAPAAGFAVLCGWTALALGLAAWQLRRRDA